MQSIDRERTAEAANRLRIEIEAGIAFLHVYRTPHGVFGGQVFGDGGRLLLADAGYTTEAELLESVRKHGFIHLPIFHAEFLADLPGFGLDDDGET